MRLKRPVITMLYCIAALTILQSQSTTKVTPVSSTTTVPVPVTTTTITAPSGDASLVPTSSKPPTASDVAPGSTATSLNPSQSGLALSLKKLDFSEAQMSLAGPSAIYIRSVKIDGGRVSLLFRKDSDDQWKLTETIPEEKNFFPNGSVFDFARLSKLDDGSLEIDGIVLDGKPYKTVVQLNDDNSLVFNQPLQAGSFVGLSMTRARPAASLALKDELDRLDSVSKKLDESQRMNQDMLAKIGDLEKAKTNPGDANAENQKLQDQVKDLTGRNTALNTELDSLKKEIETLKANPPVASTTEGTSPGSGTANLDSIAASIDQLQKKLAGLDQKVDQLSSKSVAGPALSSDAATLQDQVKQLSGQNAQLMAERQDIEGKLRSAFISSGYIQTIKPLLTNTTLKGFGSAKSKIGNWKITDDVAVQPDAGQYFAQLNLPLVQKRETMLYHFKAKSNGTGWVGLGLHLYAQDSTKRGYGHGKSLLVWLTRDPDYYKNNRTHLQLYKSDDDINMGRVLDSVIPESVSQEMDIEVLYQPVEQYVTVSINGVEKIRYKTWFDLNDGVEIALRSLDTAQFSGLHVMSGSAKQ